ncbi:hypothetical protein ACSBR2_020209 [Camellia fascicularis]
MKLAWRLQMHQAHLRCMNQIHLTSSEDEESTPNLEHVLNYLNSFDMANGLRSGKVPAKKKRENASHKQHRKPQRKKYRSWRVGGEEGDGMPVVRVFQKPANTGPLKVG